MTALDQIERQLRDSVAARAATDAAPARSSTRSARGTAGRWSLPRRRPLLLAAAAVVIAGVLLALGLTDAGTGSGPSPAIAAVMNRLARIAASGPSLAPKTGQYLSVRSVSDYPAIIGTTGRTPCVTYAIDHRHVWIAADGSGLLRDTTGSTTYPTPSDRALCASIIHRPSTSGETSNLWFADECFELGPTNDMQALSTNPRTLLQQMRRIDGGPRTPAEDLVHVDDFLRETDASPRLRAALYRAAAIIPGVQLLGSVRDHFGRQGLGVALTAHRARTELIFNPHTAALMGEQSTGSTPGSSYWAVYLSSRVVNHQPYPSPAPLTPPCHAGAGYSHKVPGGTVMTGQSLN
jgi:hypothetical protein